MGGSGSGRWAWHDKAQTVEDCRWIDVTRWRREGIIAPEAGAWGSWTWRRDGTQVAAIGYQSRADEDTGWVRLCYTVTLRGKPEDVDYTVPLVTVPRHFGGLQWYFSCPLDSNGRSCGRRVGKLYLPPGGRYFGCRHCYRLSYKSCQESHKYDSAFKRMGIPLWFAKWPDERALRRAMDRG